MRTDEIKGIGIDEDGVLWVKPATTTFPYIYREAMDVRWDEQRQCLYSHKPRDWSYVDWFIRIREAAKEQGVALVFGSITCWSNIDGNLKTSMRSAVTEN
jgi:hypothetical protein